MREIPNYRHKGAIFSPPSMRATNFNLSSIMLHSFHPILASSNEKSVTYLFSIFYNLSAAWLPYSKEMVAPYAFDGYTDSKRFNGWVKKCLLPILRKGQSVIMGNAAFHKSKKTKKLIEYVGCRLIYQPAYSPDLNPIEQQWAVLKRKYRKLRLKGQDHYNAINNAF